MEKLEGGINVDGWQSWKRVLVRSWDIGERYSCLVIMMFPLDALWKSWKS